MAVSDAALIALTVGVGSIALAVYGAGVVAFVQLARELEQAHRARSLEPRSFGRMPPTLDEVMDKPGPLMERGASDTCPVCGGRRRRIPARPAVDT